MTEGLLYYLAYMAIALISIVVTHNIRKWLK